MNKSYLRRIPGGKTFWTRQDPCTRIPEELWTQIAQNAEHNKTLRLQARPAIMFVQKARGILRSTQSQTGNNGMQTYWRVEIEGKEQGFYWNNLLTPGRDAVVSITYLMGEAPRFKAIQTDNPEWQSYNRRWPFFINEHYLPEQYYREDIVGLLVPLPSGTSPFILTVRANGAEMEDTELKRKHGFS